MERSSTRQQNGLVLLLCLVASVFKSAAFLGNGLVGLKTPVRTGMTGRILSPGVQQSLAPLRQLQSFRYPPQLRAKEEDKDGDQLPLQTLIDNDPQEPALLAYFSVVTFGLLGLGIASYRLGGQLLGLGFADGSLGYWDAAPSYALLLVYPPLAWLYPEARGVLFKTLVVSFFVTLLIYFFPYQAINFEPTNEHILMLVGLPAVGYTSFFTLRAAKVYREILDEEAEKEKTKEKNKEEEKARNGRRSGHQRK